MGPMSGTMCCQGQDTVTGARRPNLVEPHVDVQISQARRRKIVEGVHKRQRSDARRRRAQLNPEALQGWEAAESGEHRPVRCHRWRINIVVVHTASGMLKDRHGPSCTTKIAVQGRGPSCTKAAVLGLGPCLSLRLRAELLQNRHLRMGPQWIQWVSRQAVCRMGSQQNFGRSRTGRPAISIELQADLSWLQEEGNVTWHRATDR